MTHPTLELIRAITAVYYHPPTVSEDCRLVWKKGGTRVEAYLCPINDCVNFEVDHCGRGRRFCMTHRYAIPRHGLHFLSSDLLSPWWNVMDLCFSNYVSTPSGLKLWEHELTPRGDV